MKTRKKIRKNQNEDNKETIFAIAAAVLVLFSAMINPWLSFALSAAMLIAFIVYKIISTKN